MKMHNADASERLQREREEEEREKQETESRRHANNILMNHGITQSLGLEVSRKAAFERKLTNKSINNAKETISQYESELTEFKIRLYQMEAAELQRRGKEAAYAEELANNHGKPKSFFQAPNLSTRVRSNSRRLSKLNFL